MPYASNERRLEAAADRRLDEGRETVALTLLMVKLREKAQRKAERVRRLAKMKESHPEKYAELRRRRERRRAANRTEAWKARKREWRRKWRRSYLSDPQTLLAKRLRGRLAAAIRGKAKAGSAVDMLGCSVAEAISHIERQFTGTMSWSNWGRLWHLDHIRPLVRFDLTDADQLSQACHFTNLRPLWKEENLSKGGKSVYLL